MQYRLRERDSLDRYFADHAERMRDDGLNRFGDRFGGRFSAMRRVMERRGGLNAETVIG